MKKPFGEGRARCRQRQEGQMKTKRIVKTEKVGARGGGLGDTVVGNEVRASTGKGVDWG
jgi:hypothetical protein